MRNSLLKITLALVILFSTAFLAKAQKFGDNLGNHKAAKDLNLNNFQIYNSSGISIGTGATTLTNGSIGLQLGSSKAIVVSNVTTNTDIATPTDGMIIFNTTDAKFYLRQNGAWVTFALALDPDGDGINTVSDAKGYTLTTVGEQTVLKLSPADEVNPGIVTTGTQTFGGDKTIGGDLVVGSTSSTTANKNNLTVLGKSTLTGDAELQSNLLVSGVSTLTGALTVGTGAATVTTTLNGNLIITDAVSATDDGSESIVVIDKVSGEIKKSALSTNSFGKLTVPIPSDGTAVFSTDNSAVTVTLTVTGVKTDDGIVVNFPAASFGGIFNGLTILSATATGVDTVTVKIADLRNPEETPGYTYPDLSGQNLVVTRYTLGN